MAIDDIKAIIARNIRKYREGLGWTQKELGIRLGFPEGSAQNRIWQWEQKPGTKYFRSPEKDMWGPICTTLGIPLSDLLSPDGRKISEQQHLPSYNEREMLKILKANGITTPHVLGTVLRDWKRLSSRQKSK